MDKKNEDSKIEINIDGDLISDTHLESNHLNKFFKSKVEKLQARVQVDPAEALQITHDWFSGKKFGNASFKTVSTSAVRKVILRLKNTGSTGRDQIPTKVLKKFAYILAPAVSG